VQHLLFSLKQALGREVEIVKITQQIIIGTSGHLFTVTGDKRNGRTLIKQGKYVFDSMGAERALLGQEFGKCVHLSLWSIGRMLANIFALWIASPALWLAGSHTLKNG
jgi:predicted nucleotidyltransferase